MRTSTRTKRRRPLRRLAGIIVLVGLVAVLFLGGRWIAGKYHVLLPGDDYCTATVNGLSATITPDQAGNAAIIVGESIRQGLAPRAASIALATAYQESGIRNLDHGDLDSVGLFQQRPSQGWGTVAQLTDPWYASGAFYEALVKIPDWQTGDLNDIAQKVQISAHPQAYRQHVDRARALASALSGETPGAFGCRVRSTHPDPGAAREFIERVFGSRITVKAESGSLTLTGDSADLWSAVSLSIANTATTGLVSVDFGPSSWSHSDAEWKQRTAPAATKAILRFR